MKISFSTTLFDEIFNLDDNEPLETYRQKQQLQVDIFNKYMNTNYNSKQFINDNLVNEYRELLSFIM